MSTLRSLLPRLALLGKSAAAAVLLTGTAADGFAQTSVALSPPLPPKDVFQQLEHFPDPLTRPEQVPVGTVAVVDLTKIVLKRKGEPDWTRNYVTLAAVQYKNIGGVPFGAYLLTFCPPDFRRSEAMTYRRRIAEVLGKIDASLIPVSDRPRQRQILQASDEMFAKIETGVDVPHDEIEAFARRMGPLVRANFDAMAIELKPSLDAATAEMRGVLKAGEWDQLRIVIGSHDGVLYAAQERYAYFKRLLGPGSEDRVSFVSRGGSASVFRQSPASRAFFGTVNVGDEP
ncbi:hypothetical protein [Reyranella sp.]|uniref:hypothetical protein n=1 Tax=Reyranella sp. TaxID=1929291 RepID=UPI003C7C5800